MKYRTIVADPPWPFGELPKFGFGYYPGRTTRPCPYPPMSIEEIAALPVTEQASAGAHLYLWTITEHLWDARRVAQSWGFTPSAVLAWCKPSGGMGVGGKFVSNIEFILFCRDFAGVGRITSYLADAAERNGITRCEVDRQMETADMAGWWLSRLPHRSKCPLPEQYEKLKQIIGAGDEMDFEVEDWNANKGNTPRCDTRWWSWPRGSHSAKPDAFLDVVESVSPGPYLELFARRQRLGWDTWGDEALNHVELAPSRETETG